MQNPGLRQRRRQEDGYVILMFLLLMVLSLAVVGGSLRVSAANIRTTHAATVRTERYFQAESGMNEALSWLREHSASILKPFSSSEFLTRFDRGAPSIGTNDTGDVRIPTKIKIRGTTNSVILTNSSDLATSAFPTTSHISTGASFNATGSFSGLTFDDSKVRVTLVDAVPLDPAKDSPPLAAPDTDYYPVYRIDSLTDLDRGAHTYGFVTGNLFYVDTIGFYGRDYVDAMQNCASAKYTGANAGPINAKCPVGSQGTITVANNARIYGSARTNGGIVNPAGVCADYPSCAAGGSKCTGPACGVPGLPTYQSWDSYCPPAAGPYPDLVAGANQNLVLNSAGCYNSMTINNRGSYTLTNTTAPYFIKTFTVVGGNPLTQLKIAPSVADGTVQMYTLTVTGGNINGNQAVNNSARPSQFRLIYLGSIDLTLNGNARISMGLTAPYAGITVQGNNEFRGGIVAKNLRFTGSATVMYDEGLGGSTLTDVTFKMRQVEEYYR